MKKTIEDLQSLDLDKVNPKALKDQISQLLDDYEKEEDKKLFMREAGENVSKLYELVKKHAPEALSEEEKEVIEKKKQAQKQAQKKAEEDEAEENKKHSAAKKANSKKVMAEIEEIGKEIDACRQVIRDYNKKKKEAQGKEPVKKSRLTKLKEKLLGIVALIPENLRDDKATRDKTEKILLNTLSELKKAWHMNLIKPAQEAIKEKFEQLQDKELKKQEKEAA